MTKPSKQKCKIEGCSGVVPPSLIAENLCVSHYLEEAIQELEEAVTSCRDGHVVTPETLEKLRGHADFGVNFLSEHGSDDSFHQKELVLQFLIGLANLHEYLSHNAPIAGRPK